MLNIEEGEEGQKKKGKINPTEVKVFDICLLIFLFHSRFKRTESASPHPKTLDPSFGLPARRGFLHLLLTPATSVPFNSYI